MMSRHVQLELILRRALRRANILTGYRHVCRRRGCGHAELAPDDDPRRCPKCRMKLWPAPQSRPLRFHDIRHTTASLLIMAGADLPAVQRIMRHTDPRITTEFYAHLSPGYLRSAIDRLAINPSAPADLPVAASATASAPTKLAPKTADPPEFAAPLLQAFENRDLSAPGDSEKSPVFGDLNGSGIAGSNRRHSAWEADTLPTELIPQNYRVILGS
jgi:integrase